MTFSILEISDEKILILDTSVIICMHASKFGKQIFRAIPNRIFVTQQVVDELNHETSFKSGSNEFMVELIESNRIEKIAMNESEFNLYSKLISSPKSLDIGEASVIAVARHRFNVANCIPIIDERKGTKIAKEILVDGDIGTTLDLLRNPSVVSELGESCASEALFNALKFGRMRIKRASCDAVVNAIGLDRAKECNSLPNFNQRFGTN